MTRQILVNICDGETSVFPIDFQADGTKLAEIHKPEFKGGVWLSVHLDCPVAYSKVTVNGNYEVAAVDPDSPRVDLLSVDQSLHVGGVTPALEKSPVMLKQQSPETKLVREHQAI